jgi:hypothetical protein
MKRFLLILSALLLIAAIALGVFLATFNADRYRPTVVQKMEAALGRPVKLQRIALRWKGGIAAELHGLEIPPSLRVERVRLPLRIRELRRNRFRVELGESRLYGVNLLREAFDRMTVIPGLTETLLARLPTEFARKLEEKDTLFRPMDLHFTLENGVVSFGNFRVATDSFELAASGRYGLDGSLSFPAQLYILQDLSAALIKSVDELRFLSDDQWRIVLPVRVEGTLQKPSVTPDLQYVAKKLFSAKAQDLVGELLNKAFKR